MASNGFRLVTDRSTMWASASEAVSAAKRFVYVPHAHEARAIEALERGESVAFAYGFTSAEIEPVAKAA